MTVCIFNMDKKIIKFVGYSESGKTTLIENIIKKLKLSGLRVATVKHDVHGLDIDKEGNYTFKLYEKEYKNIGVFKVKKDCLKNHSFFVIHFFEEFLTEKEIK